MVTLPIDNGSSFAESTIPFAKLRTDMSDVSTFARLFRGIYAPLEHLFRGNPDVKEGCKIAIMSVIMYNINNAFAIICAFTRQLIDTVVASELNRRCWMLKSTDRCSNDKGVGCRIFHYCPLGPSSGFLCPCACFARHQSSYRGRGWYHMRCRYIEEVH